MRVIPNKPLVKNSSQWQSREKGDAIPIELADIFLVEVSGVD
jgi:hypothetical protein